MIKLYDFNKCEESNKSYGGHSGSKKGILIDEERWFLKLPKSTRSMNQVNISYTTSPLSEYIGSHIYGSMGYDVHETRLGIYKGKVVVACKDFLANNETILDYTSIKNDYDEFVEKQLENLSSSHSLSDSNNDLEEITIIMDKNKYFKAFPELKIRFWDMFIIDALISNNDRNEGNWGLITDLSEKNKIRLAPIFDNGSSFYNKSDDEKFKNLLKDFERFKNSIYESAVSIFKEEGKSINPLKFMESKKNSDCNEAILRVFSKIDLETIKNIIYEIPEIYESINFTSQVQKELYFKSIEYKYFHILKPIYDSLKN